MKELIFCENGLISMIYNFKWLNKSILAKTKVWESSKDLCGLAGSHVDYAIAKYLSFIEFGPRDLSAIQLW